MTVLHYFGPNEVLNYIVYFGRNDFNLVHLFLSVFLISSLAGLIFSLCFIRYLSMYALSMGGCKCRWEIQE